MYNVPAHANQVIGRFCNENDSQIHHLFLCICEFFCIFALSRRELDIDVMEFDKQANISAFLLWHRNGC